MDREWRGRMGGGCFAAVEWVVRSSAFGVEVREARDMESAGMVEEVSAGIRNNTFRFGGNDLQSLEGRRPTTDSSKGDSSSPEEGTESIRRQPSAFASRRSQDK